MKVSIYSDEKVNQLNLIPENDFESRILKEFKNKNAEIEYNIGSFSECNGGYVRFYNQNELNADYLFLTLKEKKQKDNQN